MARGKAICTCTLEQFHDLANFHFQLLGYIVYSPSIKRSNISETREATPTKIGLHAFHINLYMHKIFEPILFFDPHGL